MPDRQPIELTPLVEFLDDLLDIPDFPDYDGAVNGLQVDGPGPVARVAVAVDASLETIGAAVEWGADLLLVHHGLFWDGRAPLTGRRFRRVAPLVRSGTALYAAHLPLDAHREVGNCAVLARALGLEAEERFGRYREADIGFAAELREDREAFRKRASAVLGGPVHLVPGGPEAIGRIGIVTGGGTGFIPEAARRGLDSLLTGEGPHHSVLDAREYGINVFYGGHYATETWGVRALAGRLEEEFGLASVFLDFPTGF